MSTITRKVPLPTQFTTQSVLACDGCGEEVGRVGMFGIGWLSLVKRVEDRGDGMVRPVDTLGPDFCSKCAPKVERAIEQEAKALRAEKVAAKADAVGTGA